MDQERRSTRSSPVAKSHAPGKWILLFVLCVYGGGCGYRPLYETESVPSIAIPFVRGDRSGHLTEALARAAATAGYTLHQRADLLLEVQIAPYESVDTGRIYQRCQDGHYTEIAVPMEGRLTGRATVRLRTRSGQNLLGPLEVSTAIQYDFHSDLMQINAFEQDGRCQSLLRFGRGQLDYFAAAQDGASTLLEKKLAQRIIEAIQGMTACAEYQKILSAEFGDSGRTPQ